MQRLETITLKQLRALRAVAELGSITGAAESMSLTPPAVHSQIRALEDNLRCRLVRRATSGRFDLTAEGIEVLRAEETMRVALTSSLEKVRALREGQSGVVVLGVVSTAKYFAPGLVALLRRAFPDIDVILRVGNRDFIISALQQGTIELVIMGRPPRTPPIVSVAIGDHPHVLIAAPENPLARAVRIGVEALLDQTFFGREEGSGTRILMTRYLDRIGEGMPYRMIEMGTNETIKQAVMAGLGVALISQHTVTEELRSGRLVCLDCEGLPITRTWYLLHRQDLEMTPTLTRVFEHIAGLDGAFLPRV
jgi:LysR family transcriptional regulator, low CO2-responsive transcriptional regulator